MLYKKSEAEKFVIAGGTKGLIYPSTSKGDQTIAYVEMDGVYPAKGYSINDICTETFYVIEGKIEVEINNKWNKLEKGDLIIVLPNQKYRTRGKAKILDFITPAWEKNNNKIITN